MYTNAIVNELRGYNAPTKYTINIKHVQNQQYVSIKYKVIMYYHVQMYIDDMYRRYEIYETSQALASHLSTFT